MSREKWLQFEQSIAQGQTLGCDTLPTPSTATSSVLPSPLSSATRNLRQQQSLPTPTSTYDPQALPTPMGGVSETLPGPSAAASLPNPISTPDTHGLGFHIATPTTSLGSVGRAQTQAASTAGLEAPGGVGMAGTSTTRLEGIGGAAAAGAPLITGVDALGGAQSMAYQGLEMMGRHAKARSQMQINARILGLRETEALQQMREEQMLAMLSEEELKTLRQCFPLLTRYYDAYISYAIYEKLEATESPISAQQLAKELNVERSKINQRLYDKHGLQPHVTKLEWSEGRGKLRVCWCLTKKLHGGVL